MRRSGKHLKVLVRIAFVLMAPLLNKRFWLCKNLFGWIEIWGVGRGTFVLFTMMERGIVHDKYGPGSGHCPQW